MADKRYEQEQHFRGERREQEAERTSRSFGRFRDPGRERDVRRYADRDRPDRDPGDRDRDDMRASPSGAFHEDAEHHHYSLAALHDLDDLSELRGRYQWRPHEYEPHYGHGPGIENMEAPRLGYGTSTTRRSSEDHELGHGGMLGSPFRLGAARPMGRGPKGYQRADGRIREDICDRLMLSWMDAGDVEVQVLDGEVTLRGTVKSREEKRAIEALAESVLGVKDIINSLRLARGEQAQDMPSAPKPGDTPLHS